MPSAPSATTYVLDIWPRMRRGVPGEAAGAVGAAAGSGSGALSTAGGSANATVAIVPAGAGGAASRPRASATGESASSASRTARCTLVNASPSRTRRTSRLLGWTFASTSAGGISTSMAAIG